MENVKDILDKLMRGLYKDVVGGLLIDYVIKEEPTGPLVVHVLLNNEAYWKEGPNSQGGWFNFKVMKDRIGNLMRYVNLESIDINVVPYFDNSKEDLKKYNELKNPNY